jgi:transposase-like protein
VNPLDKQRTKVAKIFANEDSCLRLVTAVVMEVSEQWQSSKAYLSLDNNNGFKQESSLANILATFVRCLTL